MSQAVAPRRSLQRLVGSWRPGDRTVDALVTLASALFFTVIAFGAKGGLALGRTTVTELLLILVGAAAAIAAVLLGPRDVRLPGAGALLAFAALAVLTAASIAWAVQPNDAWQEANRTIAYVAAFGGGVALARIAPQRWPSLLGGILLAGVVVSAYALATKVSPDVFAEREVFARLRQPFDYWNAVGLQAALALPAAVWLGARRHGPPLLNALAFPATALLVATILLAYSRGSLLAATVGLAIWFWLVPLRLRGAGIILVAGSCGALAAVWAFGQDALAKDNVSLGERTAGGHELGILLVLLVVLTYAAGLALLFAADARVLRPHQRHRVGTTLIIVVALIPVAIVGSLAQTEKGLSGSITSGWKSMIDPEAKTPGNDPGRLTAVGSVRARYWNEALKAFKDRPVAGVGAGGYATARTRYRTEPLEVRHAHGYVVQTLSDLGIVGLLFSLILLGSWGLAARRTLRGTERAERVGLLTLGAVVLIFGVHSFVDWTWFVPGNVAVALVAAGWIAGRGAGAAPARWPGGLRDRQRLVGAGAVALLAIAAAWSAWQPLRSHERGADALALASERKFDEAREHVADARDMNPLSIEPWLELAAIEQLDGRKDEAEKALQRAVRVQPANPLPWLRLAEYQLYILQEPRKALESIRAAVYLNPLSFEVTQRYLDVLRRLEEGKAAAAPTKPGRRGDRRGG